MFLHSQPIYSESLLQPDGIHSRRETGTSKVTLCSEEDGDPGEESYATGMESECAESSC